MCKADSARLKISLSVLDWLLRLSPDVSWSGELSGRKASREAQFHNELILWNQFATDFFQAAGGKAYAMLAFSNNNECSEPARS